MENSPIVVMCHRCGNEFSTWASRRTTCPECRAAVTVRRNGLPSARAAYSGESDGDLAAGLAAIVGLAIVVGSWFWSGVRGDGDAT
jgi:hypothetical protein